MSQHGGDSIAGPALVPAGASLGASCGQPMFEGGIKDWKTKQIESK